ncbi:MAG: hypothetical protein J0L92_14180 [Deltaproteobacteria bacterium]|nr:hypothetical protein [Deltaproteobacteria bacterium]
MPYALEGEWCGDDGRPCDIELQCVRDRCEPFPAEAERCMTNEPYCRAGLACVRGRCRAMVAEGGSCGRDDESQCGDELECRGGVCARVVRPEVVRCERGTLRRRVSGTGWEDGRYECVPVGTPCRYGSDCGLGICDGEGQLRCEPPGPHAEPPREEQRSRAPTCGPDDSCRSDAHDCECAAGSSCNQREGRCLPHAGRGESCERSECARGLACDLQVPRGGHCVGVLCMQTTFFQTD